METRVRVGRRRFRLLSAAQYLAAVVSIPFALWHLPDVSPRPIHGALTIGWFVLGTWTAVAAPRLAPWAYLASLYASAALVSGSVAIAHFGEIQVLEGFGILVLGVIAAYHVRGHRYRLFVGLICAFYVAALAINPLLVGPWVAALVVVMVVALSEITYRQVAELRTMARLDPLTGALNRKGLDEVSPAVRALAVRAGHETSVAVIDLDGFKAYNDEHGHRAGDELLIELVRGWAAALRPSDLVARVGGDEFVLVLPGSTTADTATTLDRLHRGSPALWTAGVAAWREGEDVFDVVDRADRLMYQAKRPTARFSPPPAEGELVS